jgi:hypothetical protein
MQVDEEVGKENKEKNHKMSEGGVTRVRVREQVGLSNLPIPSRLVSFS